MIITTTTTTTTYLFNIFTINVNILAQDPDSSTRLQWSRTVTTILKLFY